MTMPRPLSMKLGSFYSVYHSFESHSEAQYMTNKYLDYFPSVVMDVILPAHIKMANQTMMQVTNS